MQIANGDDARNAGVLKLGRPSMYTCPDCHGVLLDVQDGSVPRFRCHTGHAYSIESLAAVLTEKIEDHLWSAVRALDEGGSLLEQLAQHLHEHHDGQGATILAERGGQAKRRADRIRRMVEHESGNE